MMIWDHLHLRRLICLFRLTLKLKYLLLARGEGIGVAVEEGRTDPSEALRKGAFSQEHHPKSFTSI